MFEGSINWLPVLQVLHCLAVLLAILLLYNSTSTKVGEKFLTNYFPNISTLLYSHGNLSLSLSLSQVA
jgi:hypothetical protein